MGIDEISIEADGFITREQDIKPLEKVTDKTAKPTTECCYPKCEECREYVSYQGASYCTVPMVINKQIWLVTASKIRMLERCLAELQTTVFDHILGDDSDEILDV